MTIYFPLLEAAANSLFETKIGFADLDLPLLLSESTGCLLNLFFNWKLYTKGIVEEGIADLDLLLLLSESTATGCLQPFLQLKSIQRENFTRMELLATLLALQCRVYTSLPSLDGSQFQTSVFSRLASCRQHCRLSICSFLVEFDKCRIWDEQACLMSLLKEEFFKILLNCSLTVTATSCSWDIMVIEGDDN